MRAASGWVLPAATADPGPALAWSATAQSEAGSATAADARPRQRAGNSVNFEKNLIIAGEYTVTTTPNASQNHGEASRKRVISGLVPRQNCYQVKAYG